MEEDRHPKILQFACPSRGPQRLVTAPNSLEEDFDYSARGSMHSSPVSYCWADGIHVAQTGPQGPVSRSTGLTEGTCPNFLAFFPLHRGSQTLTPTAKPPESHRWERKRPLFKRSCKQGCREKALGANTTKQKTWDRRRLHKSDSKKDRKSVV